jgi:hypothetical protein
VAGDDLWLLVCARPLFVAACVSRFSKKSGSFEGVNKDGRHSSALPILVQSQIKPTIIQPNLGYLGDGSALRVLPAIGNMF